MFAKGIHPNWLVLVGIVILLAQAVGQGTINFSDALPAAYIPRIDAWCRIIAVTGNLVMTGMGMVSSSGTGMLVGTQPPAGAKNAILFFILASGSILLLAHARAAYAFHY